MTIKKHFNILCGSIILIPFLTLFFTWMYFQVTSPAKILINDYEEAKIENTENLSAEEWNDIYQHFAKLPPNVEGILITPTEGFQGFKVIFSTFKEIKNSTLIPQELISQGLFESSELYLYQFTALDTKSDLYFITRMDKQEDGHKKDKRPKFFPALFCFIVVIVIGLIVYIMLLSKNIFGSIKYLEESTSEISSGNLNAKITKSTAAPNEITSIAESIEKMQAALKEEEMRRSKFIMGISHDLRTPIAIIKGYIEALSDNVISTPEEIQDTFKLIDSKTEQLETMINTLINYMKLNYTDLKKHLKTECVTDLISYFAKDASISGNVFNRKISTNIYFSQQIFVPLDRQLITRVLENLYSNAVRYTNDGDSIEIKGWNDEQNVYVAITDTGVGIAQKDLNHIFELFYRATTSRREEGMGIGLSVVKSIIDTHGWEISVESELNKGSCFTITIPYAQIQKQQIENAEKEMLEENDKGAKTQN